MRLTACQNTPAIDAAIYRPDSTLYQLQPSFHTQSTEPEPIARPGIMVQWSGAQRTCLDLHPPRKRPRMRCRRLHVSNTDPEKPPSDLRATNRLDSTGAAGHFWWPVGARELNFFFSTPRKFRIDIPGPRTAQTIFKQLQGASHTFYPGITRRARVDVQDPSTPSPRPSR